MHYQSHCTRYNQSLTEHRLVIVLSLSSQQTLTIITWVITSSMWVVSKVSQAFDENAFAQAELCALIKAFDCVDFYGFVTKFKNYSLYSYKEPDLFLKPFLNNSRNL